MSFKKAVFFGGAVLVLAACGDATSPTSPSALSDMNGAAAAAKASVSPTPTMPPTTAAPKVPVNAMTALCGNATIHLGLDGSIIITCDESQ